MKPNIRPIPSGCPTPSNGSPASNGHASTPNATLLALVGSSINERLPVESPFTSADHGAEARQDFEFECAARQRREVLDERDQTTRSLTLTPRYQPLDDLKRKAIHLCLMLLVAVTTLSWINGAIWVEAALTDSLWRGLVICSVIPVIPFIFKFFLLRFTGRNRLVVEAVLFATFLISFGIFADQFAAHFALKPGIVLPADSAAGDGFDPGAAFAPVSLRWFYFSVLIVESLGSFVFFSWLLDLLTPRINPYWEEATRRLQSLNEQLIMLESRLAELAERRATLAQRKAAQHDLQATAAHLFAK